MRRRLGSATKVYGDETGETDLSVRSRRYCVCGSTRSARAAVQLADHYAAVYQVPRELVHSIIEVESGWQPHAVSNKGAVGLMQLMPATAVTFGVTNRFEIDQNIRGGVAFLARLLKLFKGDLRLVAAAYITGEKQILRAGLQYSNAEVYKYVAKVARLYQEKRLKRLQTEVRAPNTLQGGNQL
jgi:soluble lytic murein transglycosylase-like protein